MFSKKFVVAFILALKAEMLINIIRIITILIISLKVGVFLYYVMLTGRAHF